MNEIQTKAINGLDGMAEIVEAEMLVVGSYITGVLEPGRVNAICGGRKACALGSLWLGYGIKPQPHHVNDGPRWAPYLPGIDDGDRAEFLEQHPGLRLAYDHLNKAADDWAKDHPGVLLSPLFEAPIEALFEGSYASQNRFPSRVNRQTVAASIWLRREDMLDIIKVAKESILKESSV